MLESVSPGVIGKVSGLNRSDVKNEFAAIFYREILKQSFSGDFMGMSEGSYATMAKEVFIEKMAKDLAEKNSSLMPDIK